MEERIAVTNSTQMNLYVGSNIVPPGETRDFPESQVPHHLRPTKAEEAPKEPNDPLAELLKGNVASVVGALNGMLFADIERLGDLEQAGQARKGVLSAIADIQLRRAANAELLAKVEGMSDAELAAALEEAKTDINIDPEYLSALEAEAANRNPGDVE